MTIAGKLNNSGKGLEDVQRCQQFSARQFLRRGPTLALRIFLVCICLSLLTLGQGNPETAAASSGTNSPVRAKSSSTANPTAQPNAPAEPETPPKEKTKEKQSRWNGAGVAPLPISSPAIGSGVVVPVPGYIFPLRAHDKVSPPSVVGTAGLFTNNGSQGFAVGGQLFFKENTYELTSGFVHGNINYDIYGNVAGATDSSRLVALEGLYPQGPNWSNRYRAAASCPAGAADCDLC